MTCCAHTNIILIPGDTGRLRCRHCHLTLKTEELENGFCPECLAVNGHKRTDFEKIEPEKKTVRYRCEACGALLGGAGNNWTV